MLDSQPGPLQRSPVQERGHLGAGDGSVGAEDGSVAAACGDALLGEPHDLIGEDAVGDVAEHGQ